MSAPSFFKKAIGGISPDGLDPTVLERGKSMEQKP